jgi:hypothetical protein
MVQGQLLAACSCTLAGLTVAVAAVHSALTRYRSYGSAVRPQRW